MNATQLLVIIGIIVGIATLYLVWKKCGKNNEVIDLAQQGLVVDLDRSVKYTTARREEAAEAAAAKAREDEAAAAKAREVAEATAGRTLEEAAAAKTHAEAHPLAGICRFDGCGKK